MIVTSEAAYHTCGLTGTQAYCWGYDSHSFADASGTNASPAAWPANGTEAFGYTTQSSSLSGTAGRFHTNALAALSTTGQEIMRNVTTPGPTGDTNCIAFQASEASATPADTYEHDRAVQRRRVVLSAELPSRR